MASGAVLTLTRAPAEIAAPKPRTTKKRASAATPDIRLHAPAREHSSPLPIVAGIILIAVGSAFALFFRRDAADPHFIRAKAVLEHYELGKPEEARDYGHPAYAEALAELGLVDRASPSVLQTDELAADIRRRIAEQQARVRARAIEMQTRQELQQRRDEEFFRERRLQPPPQPNAPAPECEEENAEEHSEGEHQNEE